MANAVGGILHGATITLDGPIPPLEGRRVRVVIELEIDAPDQDRDLSASENAALLREWAAHGAHGPIDDDEDFPGEP